MTEQVVESPTFTDHAQPVLSAMIVEYLAIHPDVEYVMNFLTDLGLSDDLIRDYLAWLNGESVTIRLPHSYPATLQRTEPPVFDIVGGTPFKPTINMFTRLR